MTSKILNEALAYVQNWPEEAQQELAQIALEIDAGLKSGTYAATPEELSGIDRGLQAASENRFAGDADVHEVLSKRRA